MLIVHCVYQQLRKFFGFFSLDVRHITAVIAVMIVIIIIIIISSMQQQHHLHHQ